MTRERGDKRFDKAREPASSQWGSRRMVKAQVRWSKSTRKEAFDRQNWGAQRFRKDVTGGKENEVEEGGIKKPGSARPGLPFSKEGENLEPGYRRKFLPVRQNEEVRRERHRHRLAKAQERAKGKSLPRG